MICRGCRVDKTRPRTPRFNMPFELGLTVALKSTKLPNHAWVVCESCSAASINLLAIWMEPIRTFTADGAGAYFASYAIVCEGVGASRRYCR